MAQNVKSKTGKIVEGLKKGQVGEATILRITDGIASDFMTMDQIAKRQVQPDDPFTEIEIVINGTVLTKTMKDYTRIGDGGVPQNSTMGRIMSICEFKEDGTIPMISKEIEFVRDGRQQKMVVWDIAI